MNGHGHHMEEETLSQAALLFPQMLLALPFVLLWLIYLYAVIKSNKRRKIWPVYRTILWSLGIGAAIVSVAGPLAERAHFDFTTHMYGHLLLGMLSPLLMALAAPMTLLFRTLNTYTARRLTSILKSRPAQWMTHPAVASILNIGGLWILYTTDFYAMMHENMLVHIIVHFHVFLAGYLFTISMIYIDPVAHRTPFMSRSAIFVFALAGHGILSKYIYANPPAGVPAVQAETGAMVMYYGGDLIDLMLIIILCWQWYKAAKPRASTKTVHT